MPAGSSSTPRPTAASSPTAEASTRPAATPGTAEAESDVPWHNTVSLCGRLSAVPETVDLPSGDPLWRFRVSVLRPATKAVRGRAAVGTPRRVVDAVDCSTSSARVAQRLQKASVGAVVDVHGVLTRRFWRAAGGGPASRYEVVVAEATIVRAAPA